MKEFIDGKNRTWMISLNIASAKRIRDLADFDIVDPENPNVLINLMSNPILIADIGWAIISPDALNRDVDADSFGESLDGDSIDLLREVILEEYVNFSGSRNRPANEKKIKKMREMEGKANDLIVERLENLTFDQIKPEVIRLMTSGAVATASQESLGSTRAD